MTEGIVYRGRTIEPQAYQSDGEQWRPKAIVFEMAKNWIDERS
jgi:hypothetical protein